MIERPFRKRLVLFAVAMIPILAALLMHSFTSAESGNKENDMESKALALKTPPIDEKIPAVIETATFALG